MLLGVDIADVSRFENVSNAFLDKCFTEDEIKLFEVKNAAERMAANYASKEAFAKAMGTGISGFGFKDISVLRDEDGKPYFVFSQKIRGILNSLSVTEVAISMSHDGGVAVAVVSAKVDEAFETARQCTEKTDIEDDGIINLDFVKNSIPKRKSNTHKGDYGKIFIVAGSTGLTGAGILASKGALFSGGGLITLGCPENLNSVFETALAEVMTLPLPQENGVLSDKAADLIVEKANQSSVVAFGSGLTNTKEVYSVLKKILRDVNVPVVIDADGINALSRNINILKYAKNEVVLTPHVKEFSRLCGLTADEILKNPSEYASEFATKWGVTVVLKSHETVVALKDGTVRKNILGNPGMATGGTGDVLAGVVASFVAQNIPNPAESAVYVHSLSADILSKEVGEYGVTPTKIAEKTAVAINYLQKMKGSN